MFNEISTFETATFRVRKGKSPDTIIGIFQKKMRSLFTEGGVVLVLYFSGRNY